MSRPDQPSRASAGDTPESVCRSLLAADPRPAIRSAPAPALRDLLSEITSHLCLLLQRQASDFTTTAPPPDRWPGSCAIGSGLRAGFQLYHDLTQAVAASWLHATGFDPAQAAADPAYHAAVISPSLTAATRHQIRAILLDLTSHIDTVTADAATSAALSAATQLPDDLRDIATGVTAAIALYQHTVFTQAADILHCLQAGLGTSHATSLPPFTPPGAPGYPISPN
jgi:hypothetical protein